jgi:predicted GTPase
MDNSWENVFIEDVKGNMSNSQGNLSNSQGNLSNSQGNLSNSQGNLQVEIKELLKARLTQWKDVEVKFGITGDSGVGKSSFINAIRG